MTKSHRRYRPVQERLAHVVANAMAETVGADESIDWLDELPDGVWCWL